MPGRQACPRDKSPTLRHQLSGLSVEFAIEPGPASTHGNTFSMTAVDFAFFVNELATLSGRAILPFFRSAMMAEDKSGGGVFDPVTEADRAAEVAMRQMIRRTFPAHGVIGE